MNQSFCLECRDLVPTRRETREGKVYLVKDCPTCGTTEALVSNHADRHDSKRELDAGYEAETCPNVRCASCTRHRRPRYAFVDVTNRCNLNCPMCVDGVQGHGFVYEPPMEHFQRIFDHLAEFDPKPTIALFGGEPTVRKDILDIIKLSRSYGFETRVLTNGLRLADPEFCREIVETHAHLLISYDGANREAYAHLRGTDKAFDLKQQGIANIKKLPRGKISYVSCLTWGLNHDRVPELLEFAHDQHGKLHGIYLMPLVSTWKPEEFDFVPERMTTEDVEQLVDDCFPGHDCQFISLGLGSEFTVVMGYLGREPFPYSGTHPNCESLYLLFSDGEKYLPIDHFLRTSLPAVAGAFLALERKFRGREKRWETSLIGRALGAVGLRKAALRTLGVSRIACSVVRHVRLSRFVKGWGPLKLYHLGALFLSRLFGARSRESRARHMNVVDTLRVIVLPLEDDPIVETDRLERCPSCHVVYNPRTEEFRYIPVCSWRLHNQQILGEIAAAYAEEQPVEEEAIAVAGAAS